MISIDGSSSDRSRATREGVSSLRWLLVPILGSLLVGYMIADYHILWRERDRIRAEVMELRAAIAVLETRCEITR